MQPIHARDSWRGGENCSVFGFLYYLLYFTRTHPRACSELVDFVGFLHKIALNVLESACVSFVGQRGGLC